MWIDPIFDRVQADVDLMRLDPTNSNNKGSYNYTDLNRIENDCYYIMDIINTISISENPLRLTIKTNWNVKDIPTITEINRIRSNIETLLNSLNIANYELIEHSNTMDFKKANILEKNLYIMKETIGKIEKQFYYCGTFYCGQGGILICT